MFPWQNADARLWESEAQILIRQSNAVWLILRKMSWQHNNAQKDQEHRSFEVVITSHWSCTKKGKSTNLVLVQLCDFVSAWLVIDLEHAACHWTRQRDTDEILWRSLLTQQVDRRQSNQRGGKHKGGSNKLPGKTEQWRFKIKQEVLRHQIRQNYFFFS